MKKNIAYNALPIARERAEDTVYQVFAELWMINLFHPCREVDMIVVDCAEDYLALTGQGYVRLDVLRSLVAAASELSK